MRRLLRLLLAVLACLLLASVAGAEETAPAAPDREPEVEALGAALTEEAERCWANRLTGYDARLSFQLTDRGRVLTEQSAKGCLEVFYCFPETDWESFSLTCRAEGDSGPADEPLWFSSTAAFDPFGARAVLRVRCFFCVEDGALSLCQAISITSAEGLVMYRSMGKLPAEAAECYVLRFEAFPESQAPEPGQARSREPEDDPPVQTGSQCWTYVSSDGRPLWRVTLTGEFQNGSCLTAAGQVEILDWAWRCDAAEFFPDGAEAVALVRVRRVVLGVPVAQAEVVFRYAPP